MRQHLLECLQNHKMKPFPRFRILTNQVPLVGITKDIQSTQKWVTPRKHAKRNTLCTDNISKYFSSKNRYALLTNQTDNVDFSRQHVTEKGAIHSICDFDEIETNNNYQTVSLNQKRTNIITLLIYQTAN